MTLAIDIAEGQGLNNEASFELVTTKEEQRYAVLAVHFTVNTVVLHRYGILADIPITDINKMLNR